MLATGNQGKVAEFTRFFQQYNIDALSLLEIEKAVPTVEETGLTFEENAALKAEQIAGIVNKPTIADDSGLIIDALDGKPGVFSARYAGQNSNDEENMDKVIEEMKNIPMPERTARFVCVIAISIPKKQTVYHTGYCEGKIAFSKTGMHGFGYDPIFIPEGRTVTMAELSAEEKNKISHRGQAFKQLAQWLDSGLCEEK